MRKRNGSLTVVPGRLSWGASRVTGSAGCGSLRFNQDSVGTMYADDESGRACYMYRTHRFASVFVAVAAALSVAACGQPATSSPTAAASKPTQSTAPAAASSPASSAAAASPSAGGAAAPSPAASPAAASSAASGTNAVAKVNANTASVPELQAAFEAAGVTNAARWAREVDEYRPYPTNDSNFAKLRQELAKYNPSADTV